MFKLIRYATLLAGGVVAGALVVLAVVNLGSAANVHFKSKSGPSFTDQGLTLNAGGALAGLGSADLLVNLTATGNPAALCTNQGGNEAPGQNPAAVTVGGTQAIPASAVKNGNVTINVTTQPPSQPTARQAGCPSNTWSAAITNVAFTSAVLTVQQGGETVLTVSCTFSPPTSDGPVPAGNVSC